MTAFGEATSGQLVLRSSTGRIVLTTTVAAASMASLDATVVNVALPHIGDDLDAGVGALQWVLTGYLLALASLILLAGMLGDRFGRRRVFVVGTAWFAVASLLCGVAPSIEMLIAARVLQGAGGALLTPGSLALVQASFREADRAPAVGAWSGLGGVAGAVGPFVGGALVDGPGWRWAFLLNLPVAAAVILLAHAAVPESKDEHVDGRADVRGAAYATVALGAGTWALIEAAPRGLADGAVIAAAAVAVAAGAAFVIHLRRATNPLVPPALFRDRTFTVVNIGTALLYSGIALVFFLVAYQLQVAAGWSAFEAGVALLPTTLAMLVLSAPSGALAERLGPRPQLTVGPLVTAAGLLLLATAGTEPTWMRDVFPGSLLFGLGLATFVAPLTATVMAAADEDHVNIASGVNNAIARAAALAGLATIPVAAGLPAAVGPEGVTEAVRAALVATALVVALGGLVMWIGLEPHLGLTRPAGRVHCAIDGPPLQARATPRRRPPRATSLRCQPSPGPSPDRARPWSRPTSRRLS